jgi:hypothetical protein
MREPLPAWAEKLTRWLDDLVRIPGTRIGFGLDALVGLIFPGAGDALTGVGSVALLWLALKNGVPRVVVARMVVNLAVDALLGAVPVIGDLFDVAWKANRKNLELLERYRTHAAERRSLGDYLVVGLGLFVVLLAVLAPILLVAVFARLVFTGTD